MIAYAAIDLRGGRVVQLVGGRPEDERIALDDPAGVAVRWIEEGFAALHVVDLDAALGTGTNAAAIAKILRVATVPVQVGGGVRTDDHVDALLQAGAARVVVGTRGVQDPEWLAATAARHPARLVLAADVRDGAVVTHGWTATTAVSAAQLLARVAALPLAAVLVTDVTREGRMLGVDESLFAGLARIAAQPIIASGGVAGPADLSALERAGAAGVVLGMALYTGALSAADTARSYAA